MVYSCPASVVYHVGGATLPKGNSKKVFLNFRNNLVMITKNLPASQLVWKIPFRIALNKIFALKALLKGNGSPFIAVFRAHLHYLRWLFFEKNKKRSVNKTARLHGMYKGLVIWQYFVNRKRTFSEIVTAKDNI